LKAPLEALIDPMADSLRCYRLGVNWQRRHVEAKPTVDLAR
jgi:hypothetical protein